MEMQVEIIEDIGVVGVSGELDAVTAPELTQFLSKQIAAGRVKLVVNLAELTYSSSAGVRVFLGAARETRQNGGDLRIAAVQPAINKIFKLSKFDRIVKVFSTSEEAVKSYSD